MCLCKNQAYVAASGFLRQSSYQNFLLAQKLLITQQVFRTSNLVWLLSKPLSILKIISNKSQHGFRTKTLNNYGQDWEIFEDFPEQVFNPRSQLFIKISLIQIAIISYNSVKTILLCLDLRAATKFSLLSDLSNKKL